MPKFTLRQLEYFRAIAMHGSISAASEQEHLSRSALAAAMDELERSLDCQLFVRHKSQGMLLTPTGEQVLGMAHELLSAASHLETAARGGSLSGSLAVGCFTSLGPTLIPQLFGYFAKHHPAVTLRTYTEPLDKLLDLLHSGQIEMAVSYSLGSEATLQTEQLYNARLHAILPASHPLAVGERVEAAALSVEPLILLDTPPSPDFVRSYFASQDLSPHIKYRFKNFEVIRSLVARGAGYSLAIQRPAVDRSYEGLELAVRPLNPPPPQEPVHCAWPSSRRLSPNARVALEALHLIAPPVHSPDIYDL